MLIEMVCLTSKVGRTAERVLKEYFQVFTTRTMRERGGWMLMMNFVRLKTQTIMIVKVLTMKVSVMKMR